jgi:DNA/RNA-binding domain of Phe-tRNA-synthetase-like protein
MESNPSIQIQISPSLEELLRTATVLLHSLTIGQGHPKLRRAGEGLGEELRRTIGDRPPSALEPVARIRRLFKSVGMDPTRERPPSERLLRRVLRGRPIPAVNDLADALNLVSLKLQFPLGVYDWDQLVPPILIRIGQPTESFRMGDDEVRLQGKVVLVDGEGPFASLTGDSGRTRVTRRTVRVLAIAFAPADVPRAALEEALREIRSAAEDFCAGRVAAAAILP